MKSGFLVFSVWWSLLLLPSDHLCFGLEWLQQCRPPELLVAMGMFSNLHAGMVAAGHTGTVSDDSDLGHLSLVKIPIF